MMNFVEKDSLLEAKQMTRSQQYATLHNIC